MLTLGTLKRGTNMAYHRAANGCGNGSCRLTRWKKQFCDEHKSMKGQGSCTCTVGFLLFPFPTAKKDTAKRMLWRRLINREDLQQKGKLWSPSKDSRVCSKHFVSGKPTPEHPNLTVNLGYDASERVNRMTPTPVRRKLERSSEPSARPTISYKTVEPLEKNEIFVPPLPPCQFFF